LDDQLQGRNKKIFLESIAQSENKHVIKIFIRANISNSPSSLFLTMVWINYFQVRRNEKGTQRMKIYNNTRDTAPRIIYTWMSDDSVW